MKNKKIISILKTFTKNEIKDFKKFIESSYFNKNRNLLLIYEQLLKNKFNPDVSYHLVLKKEYNLNINISQINVLFSNLTKLAELFLYQIHLNKKENKFQKKFFLSEYILKNKNIKLFDSYFNSSKKELENEEMKFENHYYNKFLLEKLNISYLSNLNARSKDINIQETSNVLDLYFILEKLILLIASKTRSKSVNIEYSIEFENEIYSKIKSNDYLNSNQSIQFYLEQINLLDNPTQEQFMLTMDLLGNSFISLKQKEDLVIVLYNTIYPIFKGNEYYKKLFQLYKFQIRNNIIKNDAQEISPSIFKNIITVSLIVKEIKWAEDFLIEYGKFLPKTDKKSWYSYCEAYILFEKKQYNKVLESLRESFPKDIFLNISLKRLLLKTYYELNNYSLFLSNHHAFVMYLRRLKVVPKDTIDLYKNFLDYSLQIIKKKINPEKDLNKLKEIKNEIQVISNIPEKIWLLEKIEEFLHIKNS